MKKRIAIVGGSCVDIFATSVLPLIAHDSNPGTVNIGFGGVGRNIAENLARLGQDAVLLAPFGDDPFSEQMLSHTAAAGVNTEHALISSGDNAPYYISVNDSSGDMAVAVNDIKICDRITPGFLSAKLSMLNDCDAVILDTNIPTESIAFLASHCKPPLFAEAVSTRKAVKLASALPHLHAIKLNLQEAEALLGIAVAAEPVSLQEAANRFHGYGIPYVLITMGIKGAYLSCEQERLMMSAFPVKTVNANGCGDAFGAAAFLGILLCRQPADILRTALAAAAVTAESAQAVSPELTADALHIYLYEKRK
ncbi:MAG: carbohydrate kinase family protein [Bacillota bacterium]